MASGVVFMVKIDVVMKEPCTQRVMAKLTMH